jgi:adenosyl cobinamide kinase/adenosyl cobinamide phosphate guanylyltransferase
VSLVLLLGGARSGKTELAVRLAGDEATLIATATAGDAEMAVRIQRHRDERPPGWATVEESLELGAALALVPGGRPVVIDCLTLWLSNLLEVGRSDEEVVGEASRVAAAAVARPGLAVAVSNEVGLGIVPATPLGRRHRDLMGTVNTIWAAAADRVLLVVAGRALELDAAV